MSQAFKVTVLIAYRDGFDPVSAEEITQYLRDVLTPGAWPGIILGTGLKVDEIEDPEPILSKFREAAKTQGIDA